MNKLTINRLLLFSLIFFIVSSVMSLIFATQTQTIATALSLATTPNAVNVAPTSTSNKTTIPTRDQNVTQSLFDEPVAVLTLVDHFDRKDRIYWTETSNNVDWEADGKSNPDFSVKNNKGFITGHDKTYIAYCNKPSMPNYVARMTGSLNEFDEKSSLGILVRLVDLNNWYGIRIDNSALILEKNVNGKITILKKMPYKVEKNTQYELVIIAAGDIISGQVRRADNVDNISTNLIAYDTTFTKGYAGIYATLSNGTVATITNIEAGAIFR